VTIPTRALLSARKAVQYAAQIEGTLDDLDAILRAFGLQPAHGWTLKAKARHLREELEGVILPELERLTAAEELERDLRRLTEPPSGG
jgi:hypothetical protein